MHPLLRAVAERQLGVFTASDARRAGYEPPEVRHLLRSGGWVRVRRGVYATAAVLASATPLQRHDLECVALLLQLDRPTAVISHGSAARVWGLPMRRDSDPLLRLTDAREWRRGKDFVVAQAPLHDGDSVRRGPIRLTSVTRTLVDCAREWDLESSVVALDAAQLAQVTTPGALTGALDRCAYWPGAPRARRAFSLSDGRAESPLESRGRLRLLGAGLPPDELQVEIRVGSRLVAVVDAWFDRAAVAVEFDGRVKYTQPWRERTPAQVVWEEKRREDELRSLDIRVVRIADADLRRGWPTVEQRLRALVRTPGPAHRRFLAVPRTQGRLRSA
jgi:hypothetical protein